MYENEPPRKIAFYLELKGSNLWEQPDSSKNGSKWHPEISLSLKIGHKMKAEPWTQK